MSRPLLLSDLPWPALRDAVARDGVSPEVARRLFSRVHTRAAGADAAAVLETVPGLLRESRLSLAARARLPALEVVERRQAGLVTGLAPLPTSKYVVCVSSQAGCALACDFCATGRLGAIRSLATWEILDQVRQIAAEAQHPVRGVVFMGMGEPFLNYDAVIGAAQVLSDPAGFAIAQKAITISTAGVVPMIRRYTEEGHRFRLIVSLGAPNSAARLPLMPIERRWPLPVLMDAVRAYAATVGHRMTFAYVAIGGVNLAPANARELIALLEGLRAKVSLIDVSDEGGQYLPPSEDEIRDFRGILGAAGIPVVRRYSGGKEIGAACGTLSASQQGGALVALRR